MRSSSASSSSEHLRRHVGEPLEHVGDTLPRVVAAVGVEDVSQCGGDEVALVATGVHDRVPQEVHCAALPPARQHAGDPGLHPLVLV